MANNKIDCCFLERQRAACINSHPRNKKFLKVVLYYLLTNTVTLSSPLDGEAPVRIESEWLISPVPTFSCLPFWFGMLRLMTYVYKLRVLLVPCSQWTWCQHLEKVSLLVSSILSTCVHIIQLAGSIGR